MSKFNYAVDLDGTIAHWEHKLDPGSEVFGVPFPIGEFMDGAENALRHLTKKGTVVVHSCRATWPAGGGWQSIARLLAGAGFQPMLVVDGPDFDDYAKRTTWKRPDGFAPTCAPDCPHRTDDAEALCSCGHAKVGIWLATGKPIAHFYIDDRAVHHGGDWAAVLRELATREESE